MVDGLSADDIPPQLVMSKLFYLPNNGGVGVHFSLTRHADDHRPMKVVQNTAVEYGGGSGGTQRVAAQQRRRRGTVGTHQQQQQWQRPSHTAAVASGVASGDCHGSGAQCGGSDRVGV
eukprot:COSAG01_NODE_36621_length_514_cov_45.725301_1_plen_117_part_10